MNQMVADGYRKNMSSSSASAASHNDTPAQVEPVDSNTKQTKNEEMSQQSKRKQNSEKSNKQTKRKRTIDSVERTDAEGMHSN